MDKETKIREKKKVIIEALKRCLVRDVYSRITVQEVAEESGFSKGGLLHYFPSKEDMYQELIQDLFQEIQRDHLHILKGTIDSNEKAGLSALFGIEKFFLDKSTVKIILNLLLYAYEDEKIMEFLKKFLHEHLEFYRSIIAETRQNIPSNRKTDFDPQITARIAQIIVLSAGLIEAVDPIDIDHTCLVRYVVSLLKG